MFFAAVKLVAANLCNPNKFLGWQIRHAQIFQLEYLIQPEFRRAQVKTWPQTDRLFQNLR